MKVGNVGVNLELVKDMKKEDFSKMYKGIKGVNVDELWKAVQKAKK